MKKVIIIGGMAAGCRAAARLCRLSPDFEVTIIERGSFISFSACGLPLFASGDLDGITELTKTSYGVLRDKKYFRDVKGVDVLTKTEVLEINTSNKEVKCKNLGNGDLFALPYDSLIITTGARAIQPAFPYAKSDLIAPFHSPSNAIQFRKYAQTGKIEKAVIIGGGFIGCELMESLTSLWGIETVLIENKDCLLPGSLDKEISACMTNRIGSNKIQVLCSTTVSEIGLDENKKPVVFLDNGAQISSDYVFYCLGVEPDTELAQKSGLKTGPKGGILVDNHMKTNIPGIWAAGDCVEVTDKVTGKPNYFPLGSLSNRMGRTAAESIAGNNESFDAAVGTISLKLFDDIICSAGLTENKAKELGYQTGSVTGCWPDRPDYHPESKNIFGKLVYDKQDWRLLGIQLIGEGEVTRYMDVFSLLLSQQKKIGNLTNLEHGYTPAHSSPISPLNFMGFMAINQEVDGIINMSPLEVSSFEGIMVDVREEPEIKVFPFQETAVQIPLSELRTHVGEFDPGQNIMFVCEKGPRSYEAARIFYKQGFSKLSYLGGGNLLYNEIRSYLNQMNKNKDSLNVHASLNLKDQES